MAGAFLGLALALTVSAAEPIAAPAASPLTVPDPERDGQELAAKLRDAVPERASEFKGVLYITPRDGPVTEVPITSILTLTSTNWQVTYDAPARQSFPGETLVITHQSGQPNRYQFVTGAAPSNSVATAKPLAGEELARPFAGSDFCLADLGLEFFHWPVQRKVRHEMRRSRSCNVLESINPHPVAGGYARVLSWIDVETGGIIRAEAFDRIDNSKSVKDFELGSLRKVDGQHQLESMKIRSRKNGQETELKFDLQKK